VPAEVRRRLGVGPGSVLEWEQEGEKIVIRRAGRYTSEDLHRALFPRSLSLGLWKSSKRGCGKAVRSRHALR